MDVAGMLAEASARHDTQMAAAARRALARIGIDVPRPDRAYAGITQCFANREERGAWRHRAKNARRRR